MNRTLSKSLSSPPEDLLIALNTCDIGRGTICRLARDPSSWLARPPGFEIRSEDLEKARTSCRLAPSLARQQRLIAEQHGARIITWLDDDYPPPLLELDLPPPVLYLHGRIPSRTAIAIVGSRAASRTGIQIAELFGRRLAGSGLTVVSGFARGVDTAAHRGAVESGGSTLAILGCGLDFDYPSKRRRLRAAIATNGGLISEFPFGTHPTRLSFPIRNRIIAALALGTLVVQGTQKSGSLITARLALDLGRDVYAVPGSIFDQRSKGPNLLIRDGAALVQDPNDILESLPTAVQLELETIDAAGRSPAGGAQNAMLSLLPMGQALSIEKITSQTDLPVEQVLATLLELELAGLVERHPGSLYCRKP